MINTLIDFLNSETFNAVIESSITITIIGVIVAYLFAYWTNKFPKVASQKYEIAKYRLNNILLPLQKLFLFSHPEELTHPDKINKINTIYKRHLEYITPSMQEIIKELNQSITCPDSNAFKTLDVLSELIYYEYENTRTTLKLPSQKFSIINVLQMYFKKKVYSSHILLAYTETIMKTAICIYIILISLIKLHVFENNIFQIITVFCFLLDLIVFIIALFLNIFLFTKQSNKVTKQHFKLEKQNSKNNTNENKEH